MSDTEIQLISYDEYDYDMSEAARMVEEGEKLIVDVCSKDTITRDEFNTFQNSIFDLYNDNINGNFATLLIDSQEYKDDSADVLHIQEETFYPTSLHQDISIVSAIQTVSIYEDDFFNNSNLTIREEYIGDDEMLIGYYREYVYEMNGLGEWSFSDLNGTGTYEGDGVSPDYLPLKDQPQ